MIKDVHINNPRSPSKGECNSVLTRLIRAELPRGRNCWRRMWLEKSERSRLGDVGDSVLYYSLSGLVSRQQLRIVCPIQRLSAHWFAPAKCAHWHF
jgi:hypothetical protein